MCRLAIGRPTSTKGCDRPPGSPDARFPWRGESLRLTSPFSRGSVYHETSERLAEGPGTYLIDDVMGADFIFRCPEAELLAPAGGLQPATPQGDEATGSSGHNAELPEVAKATKDRGGALGDDPPRCGRPDSGNP